MATNKNNPNTLRGRDAFGFVKAVNPQARTVDINFTSQNGELRNMPLSYPNVGSTWGRLFMPQIGDQVKISYGQADKPFISGYVPANIQYLPYVEIGEIVDVNENGSYMHLKVARRRIQSSGALVDPTATQGPNGETDIEQEAGGIVLQVRSKKNPTDVTPRYFNHSYLSMYDNGDVTIQSMNTDLPKALLHMEGESGYVMLAAGNSKVQEYIEMNPLVKTLLFMTDGELQEHVQTNSKKAVYADVIENIGGTVDIRTGVPVASIPASFTPVPSPIPPPPWGVDLDLLPGDYRIDTSQAFPLLFGGNIYFHAAAERSFNVLVGDTINLPDPGSINITTDIGDILVTATAGNITITAGINTTVIAPSVTVTAADSCFITSPDIELGSESALHLAYAKDLAALTNLFNSHTHGGTVPPPNPLTPIPTGTTLTRAS